jgi:hypothetical protein
MSAGTTFPNLVNEEGNSMMPLCEEYDMMWLLRSSMEDTDMTTFFDEVIMLPVLDQPWRCGNSAPVDMEGYPLTQYYHPGHVCVQVRPALVFFPINQPNKPIGTLYFTFPPYIGIAYGTPMEMHLSIH